MILLLQAVWSDLRPWFMSTVAVVIALLIGAAGGSLVTWSLIEKHSADTAAKAPAQVCTPVATIMHNAATAAAVSTTAAVRAAHVHDKTLAAVATASARIDAVPPAVACPSAPDPAVIADWRAGIVGVRDSAASASRNSAGDVSGVIGQMQ